MMLSRVLLASVSIVLSAQAKAQAPKSFLANEDVLSKKNFEDDIVSAMGAMLGCGGQPSKEKLAEVRKILRPMWMTLPKTSHWPVTKIDRKSLRYLAHRYFMQVSSISVRGFEPTRVTNESHWGTADILSQVVPAYVESVLNSKHVKHYGFSMDDAVNMIMMLDQLIFDSEARLLLGVYRKTFKSRKSLFGGLSLKVLTQVLERYMVEWMIDGEDEDMKRLLGNKTLLAEVVPHYEALMNFAVGRAKLLQYNRLRKIPKGKGHATRTWRYGYNFDDALLVVGGITRHFQTFWQSECESMKEALVALDTHHTGRIPLGKFYGTAINTDWRFGESEAYLRELGALDDSSSRQGSQVIIPNYIQATSNCIVSTPHYLVCCQNDCQVILSEIEGAIKAPTASPKDILDVVSNITVQATLDEEYAPQLKGRLTDRLEEIASSSGGLIPLHGRLFAQWLHYAFPRECSFPHKIGTVSTLTPSQFPDYMAKAEDMKKLAANATTLPIHVHKDELHWMSQWSSEEELNVDYSSELGTSGKKRFLRIVVGLILFAFVGERALALTRKSSSVQSEKLCV